jgi:pimeloyl-ACP methyl ester carboxylesterase
VTTRDGGGVGRAGGGARGDTRWSVAGQERADRDPIILLTGVGETPLDSCDFLFSMLARNNRVVRIDLGELACARGESLEVNGMVEHLTSVTDQVAPGRRLTVIGYSTAALVAVAFAASHDQVALAVLISGWLHSTDRLRLFLELWQRFSAQDVAALADFARFSLLSPTASDAGASAAEDQLRASELSAFTETQREFILTTTLAEIAPRLAVPTLVIGAAHDSIIPIDQRRSLFAALADARYVEIDSGHAVVIERPAEVLSHIELFLREPARYPTGSMIIGAKP